MAIKNTKAHLAVLGTNLFFAINYSAVKYVSPSIIKPFALNLVRAGGSMFFFWAVWLFSKTPAGIKKEHWPRFIWCALTGVVINQLFFIKGLTMTTPIHASLLILFTPIAITVFAFWVLKEKVTLLKVFGLTAGIIGSVLLVLSKENSAHASNYLLGDFFIMINAISYAVYFIIVKPLMSEYHPLHIIRWVFTIGFVMMIPFCFSEFVNTPWSLFTGWSLIALIFIVIGGTFLAYYFNIYGIHRLGAAITGSYIYTQPVFAAIIAVFVFHEVLTVIKLLAACLIFGGVFMVGYKKQQS